MSLPDGKVSYRECERTVEKTPKKYAACTLNPVQVFTSDQSIPLYGIHPPLALNYHHELPQLGKISEDASIRDCGSSACNDNIIPKAADKYSPSITEKAPIIGADGPFRTLDGSFELTSHVNFDAPLEVDSTILTSTSEGADPEDDDITSTLVAIDVERLRREVLQRRRQQRHSGGQESHCRVYRKVRLRKKSSTSSSSSGRSSSRSSTMGEYVRGDRERQNRAEASGSGRSRQRPELPATATGDSDMPCDNEFRPITPHRRRDSMYDPDQMVWSPQEK